MKDSYAWFRGLVKERRAWTTRCSRSRGRPGLHRPPGGRSQAGRPARRRKDRVAWLAKEKSIEAICRCATTSCTPRFGDLTFLQTAASTLDALGLERAVAAAASTTGEGCRRVAGGSILTVCWPLWHPAELNRPGRWALPFRHIASNPGMVTEMVRGPVQLR